MQYKTNHYLLPLLTVMCIDQNGAGHLVLHAFIRHEDKIILGTCFDFLVDRYDSSQTSTIFVDKDLTEVAAIKSAMPQVEISLCRFHMKQAIKRVFQGKGLAAHILKLYKIYLSNKPMLLPRRAVKISKINFHLLLHLQL